MARLGRAAWRTLTSVKFAVLQITVLSVAGVIGTILDQIPAFALHDPAAYAEQLATLHAKYDGAAILGVHLGPGMVSLFDTLGFFRVFSAPWFILLLTLLVVAIVVCTLDRTPDLWHKARLVKINQAAPFFDLRLSERARFTNADDAAADELRKVLRAKHYNVREEIEQVAEADTHAGADATPTPIRYVYGDRNQYMKLTTLFTHLGLILFLAGGAVTTAMGYETVVFLGQGETAPVQAVGTQGNLLVKNIFFEAPRDAAGNFTDFRTDLAVYRDGQEVARKVIRVNDPLEVDGFVFHQNTFGPAEDLTIRDPNGRLVWDGPVLLAGELGGHPQGFMTVPGSDIGLLLVLDETADGIPLLAVTGLGQTANPEESNILFIHALGLGGQTTPPSTVGYTIAWDAAASYTGMVIKNDPGAPIIWIAYMSLIIGLVLTFYFPRRRVWARLHGDHLEMAFLGDRYVNAEREFGEVLDELSTRLRNRPERRLQPSAGVGRA
ncbi:MAG TPA: cytochrome c biogenesis protein ResB [Candidatus Limnocylindrales bacterium]|nr:cytochrome c biogenesis protein ResB [Candidatus Limnocylindrales bacterium]